MSNFPLVRYKATDTWIPSTDIDGIDANEQVIARCNNIEFSNGFFENGLKVKSVDLPSNVYQEINDYNYEILSAKIFRHSTQGVKTVYILWNESVGLKIYLDNNSIGFFSNNNTETTENQILAKPMQISYNLVNDQLKINLNVMGNMLTMLNKEVMLNLTLCYLPEIKYTEIVYRSVGWYLIPRWLGWNIEYLTLTGSNVIINNELTENFDDVVAYREYTLGHWWKELGRINQNGSNNLPFVMKDLADVKKITLKAAVIPTYTNQLYGGLEIGQYKVDGTLISISNVTMQETTNFVEYEIDIDSDNCYKITIRYINSDYIMIDEYPRDEYGQCAIDWMKFTFVEFFNTDINNTVVLAKYFDGQRGMVKNIISVTTEEIKIKTSEIDWRIISYEIYRIHENVYVKIAEAEVDNNWTVDNEYLKFLYEEKPTESTLNFNYNLPSDARVDNERIILSEIAHKGRVYFVNGDYKVYQSHISTNLAIQADAFPYDEETGFGYFIVDNSKVNLALANSPTNDMVIITNQGMYPYFIQPSGSGSFKQLRMNSGSISICNIDTLTSLLNGEPATDGLFWIDYNGIYYYAGGMTPPENLITLTHLRYWQSISKEAKENAIGFYNPVKKEYWLYIDNKFLIFELSFKKFREANGYSGLTKFMGYIDSIPYYMTSGNAVVSCDGILRMSAQIETHYNTVESNPEIFYKILQELYLEFGQETETNNVVNVEVWVDDWQVGTYIFDTDNKYDKWLMPVGLKFNRLKLKVLIPANKYVRIKEFGFSFDPDIAEPLGIVPVSIAQSGFGFDFGNNFGS